MSNLPHPLGDSTPGDLFYPGSPSVTVSDSPGAAGSRAVEYGEDGYSAAANRGLYALGKNDEYMQERLETKMAHISFTEWTPSGGNGDEYVFSAVDVFVGGSNYLPETQAIRESLISVLDGDYNELIDPATGDKIVVKEILNSAKTASIVGDPTAAGGDEDGFYNSGATIHFRRAHPVTGVLGADYTIPNSTDVILVHGISGTLDTLATGGSEHLMRGAFVEGSIRSAQELPAGAFLLDGSRKAIGDFDMDTYAMIGDTFYGHGSNPLQIGDASGERIWFRDAWQNCYLNNAPSWDASGHETGLQGAYTSILGSLNAATVVNQHWCGNRTTNKVGSFSYTDGTGQIDYPTLRLQLNGQYVVIPSDSITANNTGSTIEYLAITASGTIVKRTAAAVLATDIVVEEHVWNGSAFTSKYDLRWPVNNTQNTLEITCGDGAGADFTDFADAVIVGRELARVGKEINQLKIRIIGTATWADVIELDPAQDVALCISGDGSKQSIINLTADTRIDLDSTSSGSGVPVYCEGVCFNWASASDMSSGYYIFTQPGDGSRIKNCSFTYSSTGYGYGIISMGSASAVDIAISECIIDSWLRIFYSTTSAVCDNLLIENCSCLCDSGAGATTAIYLAGRNGKIVRNVFDGDWSTIIEFNSATAYDEGFLAAFNRSASSKSAANTGSAFFINSAENFNGTIAFNDLKNFRTLVDVTLFSGLRCRCDILYNRFDSMTHDTSAFGVWISSIISDLSRITIKGNSLSNTITTIPTKFVSIDSASSGYDRHHVDILDNFVDEGIAVYINTSYIFLRCSGNTFKAPTLAGESSGIIQAPAGTHFLQKGSELCNNHIHRRAQSTTAILAQGIGISVCNNSFINSDIDPSFNEGSYSPEVGVNVVMDVTATPPAAVQGERYLVYTGATGAWAGQDGKIAEANTTPDWDFITPGEQDMVWAEQILGNPANVGWYCHYGTYSGWGGTGNQGWYYSDLSVAAVILKSFSTYTHTGNKCSGNKIIGGTNGVILANENDQVSITDNFFRDLLSYGVKGSTDSANLFIGYNQFFNVHGYGVESAVGDVVVIGLDSDAGYISNIIGNVFEDCGHHWVKEDDVKVIFDAGDGRCIVSNNVFNQIFGGGPSETLYAIYVGTANIIGNVIYHEYNKTSKSNPKDVIAVYVSGTKSTIWGNHISFIGTPAADADSFTGISLPSTATYSSICMNKVDIAAVGTLLTYYGIICDGDRCVAIGNDTGNVTVPLNQDYSGTSIGGFVACNYAQSSASVITSTNQEPANAVSAPVDLRDELNK